MDFKEEFRKALLKKGIDIRTTVHWADSEVKKGYFDDEFPDNYYLKASTEYLGHYEPNDVLVLDGEEGLERLQAIAKHFTHSIEPVEIFD
jgi:hypothetical protein